MFSLITGIIVLIIGIILFAVSRALPPVAATIAYWLGILLAVIGVIIIVVAILTGALGTGGLDLDVLSYPVLQHLQ
jgi:hypothetical protein